MTDSKNVDSTVGHSSESDKGGVVDSMLAAATVDVDSTTTAVSASATDASRGRPMSEDTVEDETELTLALETSLALLSENHRLREEKAEVEQRLNDLEMEIEEHKSEIPSLLSTIEYYKKQCEVMMEESTRRDDLLAMRESELKNLSLKMEQSEAERSTLHRELTRLSSAVHLTSDSDDDTGGGIIPHSMTMPVGIRGGGSIGGRSGSGTIEVTKDDFSVGAESSSSSTTRRRGGNHSRSATAAAHPGSSVHQAIDASKAALMNREDRKQSKREMRIEISSLQVQLDQQMKQINELISEVESGREVEMRLHELEKHYEASLVENDFFNAKHEALNKNYVELTYDKIALEKVLEETQGQLDAALKRERDLYAQSTGSLGRRRRGSITDDESSGPPGTSSVMNTSRTLRRRLSKQLKADYSQHSLLYDIAHRFKSSSDLDTEEDEDGDGGDDDEVFTHAHIEEEDDFKRSPIMDRRRSSDDLSAGAASGPSTLEETVAMVVAADSTTTTTAESRTPTATMNDVSMVEVPVPAPTLEQQVQALTQTTETEDSISSLSALQQIENVDDQKVIEEVENSSHIDEASSMDTAIIHSTTGADHQSSTIPPPSATSLTTSIGTEVSLLSTTATTVRKTERMPDPPKLEITTEKTVSLKAAGSRPSSKTSTSPRPSASSSSSKTTKTSLSGKSRHTDAYNEFLHLSAAAAKINFPSVHCTSKELIDRVAGLPFYQVNETMNRYLLAKLQWQSHEESQLQELERASIEANRAIQPGSVDTGDGLSAAIKEATSLSKWWSRMWGTTTSTSTATSASTSTTAAASSSSSASASSASDSGGKATTPRTGRVATISEGKYSGHGIIQRTQSGGISFTVGPLLSSLQSPGAEPGLVFSGVHTAFTPGTGAASGSGSSASGLDASSRIRSSVRPRRRSSVSYTVPSSRFYNPSRATESHSGGAATAGGSGSSDSSALPSVTETKPL